MQVQPSQALSPWRRLPALIAILLAGLPALVAAAEPASEKEKQAGPSLDSQIRADLPVIYLSGEAVAPGYAAGKVEVVGEGLDATVHERFEGQERGKALRFDGDGARLMIADPGPGSQFDFDNGDPITIEAWVNLGVIGNDRNLYLIGKGRTHREGFSRDNQNWALRLRGENGEARPSFLFRSRAEKDKPGEYHRWTGLSGFAPGSGWHYLAVSYRFGEPESIRAWVDGFEVQGSWDMGGATKRAPVVDDDELWVASAMGGSASSSFKGEMAHVAVYRRAFDAEHVAARYSVDPYQPGELPESLPEGRVLVEIVEGIGSGKKWPQRFRDPVERFVDDSFAFFELPQRYTRDGVRADRPNQFLLRASGRVELPSGQHRLLLRSRGAGRLWLDGKLVAETSFPRNGGGGHNEVPETPESVSPTLRVIGPGDREKLVEIAGDGRPHDIVFEMLVGDGKVRPTLGETSISLALEGSDDFYLLAPKTRIALTDAGWKTHRAERSAYYQKLNAERRAEARQSQNAYWSKRHQIAREVWSDQKVSGKAEDIDRLLVEQWVGLGPVRSERKADGIDFEHDIKPIFAEHCFRCHGEKEKGGLRLDTREAALKGGDSELAAIVPGDPHQSYLIELLDPDAEDRMPPKGDPLSAEQRELLSRWVGEGAPWSEATVANIEPTPLVGDAAFLRRVSLDTIGLAPSEEELRAFLADERPDKRARAIDRLLADDRWADRWVSYWQDVLAENPNILKPTLNNSGPFRFWIHEALQDNLPMDRFVTQLVMMGGSERNGGPAGFGLASQNDVPMAAKAHVLGTAFLGVEMACARCHDSPYHETSQRDLFSLAAMLRREPLKVPESSSVPAESMQVAGGRKSLITLSMKVGEAANPEWPFDEFVRESDHAALLQDPGDSRERLALLVSSPHNQRFAKVIANRMWERLVGRGFVEPVSDWESADPVFPEVLDRLAAEFVHAGYDLKELTRLILNTEAYQREARPLEKGEAVTFAAPLPRRLSAEQVVDAAFAAFGMPMETEEITFDNDGTQVAKNMISLGFPERAWELTSLSNERDRPALAMPRAQAIVDVLENFGWTGARQAPTSRRDHEPNVLQPAILANGSMGHWLTTLTDQHELTEIALQPDLTLDRLVESIYLRVLSRKPDQDEAVTYAAYLSEGFGSRIREGVAPKRQAKELPKVAWSNHLSERATEIKLELERRAREGDPPTERLQAEWRERLEDVLWALMNTPEFVHLP